jgi:acyl-CoA synthetase (AMP-forming)/AMP-acid ligase II
MMRDPKMDEACIRRYDEMNQQGLTRMFDWVDKYAMERPNDLAIIEYNTETEITWKEFASATKAFAAKLLDLGLKKGDVVASMLPLLKEHVFLMYACYRIGVIFAPLDLRLKVKEVDYCFKKMKPKAFFFLGYTEVNDFRELIGEIMDIHEDTCEHWIQFEMNPANLIRGATWVRDFAVGIEKHFISVLLTGELKEIQQSIDKRDPCLIIFTTGSTGFPKPALLCHENILIQNIGIGVGFGLNSTDRMCVNLPPSHVGCVTEQLATTIYMGGVSVILHIFDAEKTLDAIERYKVTSFGQIPSLFNMQWRLENYSRYNLSSLKFALYGGQAVSKEFLEKLSTMAPNFGTGLGLTETAGFVTYTPLGGTVDDIVASVGFDMPLCPISIREPMKADGSAGIAKGKGEVGEICFSGKQVFLGYLGDKENTRKTFSTDGYVYTGDLGFYDEKGLHFSGRSKFVIKPKGYQIFPAEVESFIEEALPDKVEMAGCIGVKHEIYSEAIVLFVERKEGVELTAKEVMDAAKGMAAYKRPSYVVILNPEEMPLNRVQKTDYMVLKKMADKAVEKLKAAGKWDK